MYVSMYSYMHIFKGLTADAADQEPKASWPKVAYAYAYAYATSADGHMHMHMQP